MADFSNATWRKSSWSNANGCVEVAFLDGQVGVRDSKDRQGPMLVFTANEWVSFIKGARDGEFDLFFADAAGHRVSPSRHRNTDKYVASDITAIEGEADT